jgi:hypothetical protein
MNGFFSDLEWLRNRIAWVVSAYEQDQDFRSMARNQKVLPKDGFATQRTLARQRLQSAQQSMVVC